MDTLDHILDIEQNIDGLRKNRQVTLESVSTWRKMGGCAVTRSDTTCMHESSTGGLVLGVLGARSLGVNQNTE